MPLSVQGHQLSAEHASTNVPSYSIAFAKLTKISMFKGIWLGTFVSVTISDRLLRFI